MKITRIEVLPLRATLRKPFVTALRRCDTLDNILVAVHTDDGVGYGEGAAAAAVTGETAASITEAVTRYIAPVIVGMDIGETHAISECIRGALYGNMTAKAAVESAVYDACARECRVPLYRLLGGTARVFDNDITIGANSAAEMAADCVKAYNDGFRILKLKLGRTPETDGEILLSVWRVLREHTSSRDVTLRIDVNQGWTAKQAIRIVRAWEDACLPVAFVEQPVPAWDLEGLKTVTAHTHMPICADESVRTVTDAVHLLEAQAADMVNIKLAKTGGIIGAMAVALLCGEYGIPCMMGCMLESRLGAAVAAHVAAACPSIAAVDLDGPLLCAEDLFIGGPVFDGRTIALTDAKGIGLVPLVET